MDKFLSVNIYDIDDNAIKGAEITYKIKHNDQYKILGPITTQGFKDKPAIIQIAAGKSQENFVEVTASYRGISKTVLVDTSQPATTVIKLDMSLASNPNSRQDDRIQRKQVVVLIHGIRTRAQWATLVGSALEESGFVVAPTSYGRFGLIPFLAPGSYFKKGAVKKILTAIQTAKQIYEPCDVSVISHSFGTYVVARVMSENPHIKLKKIIFCGSVLRDDFPFEQYISRFEHPILNEVGSLDFLPALAESAGWGYGSIGANGFNSVLAKTRWHINYRHSDFLTAKFAKKFWVPFLINGTIVPANNPSKTKWWIDLLSIIPLRWLPFILLSASFLFIIIEYFDMPLMFTTKGPVAALSDFQKCTAGSELTNPSVAKTIVDATAVLLKKDIDKITYEWRGGTASLSENLVRSAKIEDVFAKDSKLYIRYSWQNGLITVAPTVGIGSYPAYKYIGEWRQNNGKGCIEIGFHIPEYWDKFKKSQKLIGEGQWSPENGYNENWSVVFRYNNK